jgi:hypothetical protein
MHNLASSVIDGPKGQRSVYALTNESTVPDERIEVLISEATLRTPALSIAKLPASWFCSRNNTSYGISPEKMLVLVYPQSYSRNCINPESRDSVQER